MQLIDTHCHIHEAQSKLQGDDPVRARWLRAGKSDPDVMIKEAAEAGVRKLICVGCTVPDSEVAVQFVQTRPTCWASIGIHPHEAEKSVHDAGALKRFERLVTQPKIVAVGECGLDYFYNHSSKATQEKMLRFQIELALKHNLPLIFHVRDAFQDFWPIFDDYRGIRGVIHSFTATRRDLEQIVQRGLYVGLNGIMTFTKEQEQLAAAQAVPLQKLLLETDAPFLTPVPHRGKICESKHVRLTAEFLASLRREPVEKLAKASTENATALFILE